MQLSTTSESHTDEDSTSDTIFLQGMVESIFRRVWVLLLFSLTRDVHVWKSKLTNLYMCILARQRCSQHPEL